MQSVSRGRRFGQDKWAQQTTERRGLSSSTRHKAMPMTARDVNEIYTLLLNRHVQIWLDGGWGIDALLGEQTRPHKDLDAFVASDSLAAFTRTLSENGFVLKEIWSENRWLRYGAPVHLIANAQAGEVATAFVLRDERGREIDIHVLDIDARGQPTPAWNCEISFSCDSLSGHGSIAGCPVRCLSAGMQMRTHIGYELQAKDLQDLRHLQERFGSVAADPQNDPHTAS
ncbi:aminoglycoside nucleotidyltransferase [soil metagenome]